MPAPLYPLGHKLESAPTLTAPQTLNMARDLGVELVLNGCDLSAVGGRNAITELAPHIRACKPELIRLLSIQPANDSAASDVIEPVSAAAQQQPEQPEQPDWRVLDSAYQDHHFKCPICIAAGIRPRTGQRCGVGAALWVAYETAALNTPPPWHQPKEKK